MMPGPIPKRPDERRRMSRASTATTLRTPDEVEIYVPPLPEGIDWAPRTIAWWHAVWRSPMAAEWLDADLTGLLVLAQLLNEFWDAPGPTLAQEVRLHLAEFGLTPIARRRLQWEIDG